MISGHTPWLSFSLPCDIFAHFCFKGLPLAFIIDIGPPLAAIKKCALIVAYILDLLGQPPTHI
jgi:hypothetical protein